jgi:hypothetical protein
MKIVWLMNVNQFHLKLKDLYGKDPAKQNTNTIDNGYKRHTTWNLPIFEKIFHFPKICINIKSP